MSMIVWLTYGVVFVGVPYMAHEVAFRLTHSSAISWVAAVVSVPVFGVLYARLFERLKHGTWGRGRQSEARSDRSGPTNS